MSTSSKSRLEAAEAFPWVVFGWTIQGALADPLAGGARDLDCAELFCGVGAIWLAAQRAGLTAVGYDMNRVPGETDSDGPRSENIVCQAGFMNALSAILRLRPGALLWLAPMCNSFCWLALSKTRRFKSNNYIGDESVWQVAVGNTAARAAAFLMTVAWVRGVHCILENPAGSRMFPFYVAAGAIVFQPVKAVCARCHFSEEPVGERLWKRYTLLSTEPWATALRRVCPCPPGTQHKLLTIRSVRLPGAGKCKCRGHAARLATSAHYPGALGTAVVAAWRRAGSSAVAGHAGIATAIGRAGVSAAAGVAGHVGSATAVGRAGAAAAIVGSATSKRRAGAAASTTRRVGAAAANRKVGAAAAAVNRHVQSSPSSDILSFDGDQSSAEDNIFGAESDVMGTSSDSDSDIFAP